MKFEKEMVLEAVFDYDGCGNLRFSSEFGCENIRELCSEMESKKVKLILEVEKSILNDSERKYLSDVIKPFKNEIRDIMKISAAYKETEYIKIHFEDDDEMSFKDFKKGTMYKNMKLDKKYTIEELGL